MPHAFKELTLQDGQNYRESSLTVPFATSPCESVLHLGAAFFVSDSFTLAAVYVRSRRCADVFILGN